MAGYTSVRLCWDHPGGSRYPLQPTSDHTVAPPATPARAAACPVNAIGWVRGRPRPASLARSDGDGPRIDGTPRPDAGAAVGACPPYRAAAPPVSTGRIDSAGSG